MQKKKKKKKKKTVCVNYLTKFSIDFYRFLFAVNTFSFYVNHTYQRREPPVCDFGGEKKTTKKPLP